MPPSLDWDFPSPSVRRTGGKGEGSRPLGTLVGSHGATIQARHPALVSCERNETGNQELEGSNWREEALIPCQTASNKQSMAVTRR